MVLKELYSLGEGHRNGDRDRAWRNDWGRDSSGTPLRCHEQIDLKYMTTFRRGEERNRWGCF